jgi:hypothetical protein
MATKMLPPNSTRAIIISGFEKKPMKTYPTRKNISRASATFFQILSLNRPDDRTSLVVRMKM